MPQLELSQPTNSILSIVLSYSDIEVNELNAEFEKALLHVASE